MNVDGGGLVCCWRRRHYDEWTVARWQLFVLVLVVGTKPDLPYQERFHRF
jgi:hypothetical protein